VSHVWVGGELRVDGGIVLQISNTKLLDAINLWRNKLKS